MSNGRERSTGDWAGSNQFRPVPGPSTWVGLVPYRGPEPPRGEFAPSSASTGIGGHRGTHPVADLPRRVGPLSRPVAEARTESVRHGRDPQLPEQSAEGRGLQPHSPRGLARSTPTGACSLSPRSELPAHGPTAAPSAHAGSSYAPAESSTPRPPRHLGEPLSRNQRGQVGGKVGVLEVNLRPARPAHLPRTGMPSATGTQGPASPTPPPPDRRIVSIAPATSPWGSASRKVASRLGAANSGSAAAYGPHHLSKSGRFVRPAAGSPSAPRCSRPARHRVPERSTPSTPAYRVADATAEPRIICAFCRGTTRRHRCHRIRQRTARNSLQPHC